MYLFANGPKLIELKIIGYEFPDGTEYYDVNWLNLKIKVESEKVKYEQISPCILTFEIEDMILGMSTLLKKRKSVYHTNFMEPYLSMEFKRRDKIIDVKFRHEIDSDPGFLEMYETCFSIPKREFGEVLRQLKEEYEKYPKRNGE